MSDTPRQESLAMGTSFANRITVMHSNGEGLTSSVLRMFSASFCASDGSMVPNARATRRCSQKASRRMSCGPAHRQLRHQSVPTETPGRPGFSCCRPTQASCCAPPTGTAPPGGSSR